MASSRAIRVIPALSTARTAAPRLSTASVARTHTSWSLRQRGSRSLHVSSQLLKPATSTVTSSPEEYPTSHEQILEPVDTHNFLNNEFVPSKTTQWIDLHDPATNNLVTSVPQSTY